MSHQLLFLQQPDFSYELLSDIVYFYAFTHTYFSPNEYDPFNADEIAVAVSEITGERVHANERKEKSKKKYASPFVWGQLASWYKQTIVCPEASLSQDRRGTLSYPIIKSIMYKLFYKGRAIIHMKSKVDQPFIVSFKISLPTAGPLLQVAIYPSKIHTNFMVLYYLRTFIARKSWLQTYL